MPVLALTEIVPSIADRTHATTLIEQVAQRAAAAGGELIESQVTSDGGHVFVITEVPDIASLTVQFVTPLDGAKQVSGPDQVRLVGADLEQIKAVRPGAGYLVEWDIPAHIDMDTYLTRKKEKSPRYAQIPEVSFLRTYVREDVDKCLCLYDAPDTDAVVRAREIVETPISRLHALND